MASQEFAGTPAKQTAAGALIAFGEKSSALFRGRDAACRLQGAKTHSVREHYHCTPCEGSRY